MKRRVISIDKDLFRSLSQTINLKSYDATTRDRSISKDSNRQSENEVNVKLTYLKQKEELNRSIKELDEIVEYDTE